MRHRKGGKKLGRKTAHKLSLLRNLLTVLFQYERIITTEAKAKALKSLADKMITLSKREDLHARRQVLKLIADTQIVKKLFDAIAARYTERKGGYTRIIKAGTRPGDGAPMAVIELVDRQEVKKKKDKDKKGKEAKGREEKPVEEKAKENKGKERKSKGKENKKKEEKSADK